MENNEEIKKGLVSVITPCYNTGKYVGRLLDSILRQTYSRIEMFLVDDGSTDNTKTVVEGYIPLFAKRGYELTYIYQPNSGQSAAINNGLKLVTGEYLVWPDSDDFYASDDAISRMVNEFVISANNVGTVRTQELVIEDRFDTINVIRILGKDAPRTKDSILPFEDCLFGSNDFYFGAGAYMIKFEYFSKLTNREIYVQKDAGQNWQMLLPMLYSYDCVTIQEPLYYITERKNSHSRGAYKGCENETQLKQRYLETTFRVINSLSEMSEQEQMEYTFKRRKQIICECIDVALRYGDKKEVRRYSQMLHDKKSLGGKRRLKILLMNMGLLNLILKLCK